ncbi:2-acyl-glycerophospho-ethanolamine acyltransferase [Chelativorans sp. J32]|uniref:2-acyl-glycerophospho-ethanolamine acyltransferase n=1 Tax=Chelativorans sp. J32 TaxID=935840 RepID=UPI000489CC9B|nr:2-acyl-glycerophospho-ethanolamine acyltransferase [Chelativorans sp. J32]
MLTAVAVLCVILAVWLAIAAFLMVRLGLNLHQAMLYVPLKVFFRIRDVPIRQAREAEPPVIYAIWHRSRLEPALMLSLLPSDTLHILDEESARSLWLDPWRALARTIAFNAHHVFVSRRLVRRLKGRGRLAVYLPDDEAPDPKAFRLFRAIARIATNAEARIVPIHVEGAERSPFSLTRAMRRRLAPRFNITALEPLTIAQMVALAGAEKPLGANAFFDRMLAVRRQDTPREQAHEPA